MQRLSKSKSDCIIIGGGASGLAAACVCAKAGAKALLLEKEERVGRKLMATGNGRCNLMNLGEPCYFGDEAFALAVLKRVPAKQVLSFFEGLGLTSFEEEEGRVYPLTRQAASVVDALRFGLASGPVEIRCSSFVRALSKSGDGFLVKTDTDEYQAGRLILAGGSPAAPHLGGNASLCDLARGLGHRALPFRPALSALLCDPALIGGLNGLRVPVRLALVSGGRYLEATQGEALFNKGAVSGICAMQLSSRAGDLISRGIKAELVIDFSPLLGLCPWEMGRMKPENWENLSLKAYQLLEARRESLGASRLHIGLLPRLLSDRIAKWDLKRQAEFLTGWVLPLSGVRDFREAQVASGGLDTRDFQPDTLESRLVPGLYAAGEMLNVDGDCGGYNLLFAWASGILAAQSALGLKTTAFGEGKT